MMHTQISKKLSFLIVGSIVCLSLSACLKTRAQLRSESSGDGLSDERVPISDSSDSMRRPSSAPPVQDVKTHGEYAVEELKDEITRLTGRIEELERHQKNADPEKLQETLKQVDSRLAQLEKSQQAMQESLSEAHQLASSLQDPSELMKEAKNLFSDGRYQEAADQLTKYEKMNKAKNKEEAAFLKGESYFHLKQFKKAIVEYSKFPEKYTKSNFYPEALYKIGLSFDAMGLKDDAKGFYQELVEKFPKSAQAKKVKRKVKS